MDSRFTARILKTITEYNRTLSSAKVGVMDPVEKLLELLDANLPEEGETPEIAIQRLITGVEKGLIHSKNPRYFGFVIGGSSPTATAADFLTSLWDQNAQVYQSSPAAAIIEDIVAKWILDLLDLPENSGVGFVTGAQMANFTALSVARNHVLKRYDWDFDNYGLQGAPHIHILCGENCHGTIHSAIRMLGLGKKNIHIVSSDSQGRMLSCNLKEKLESIKGPTIICAQAGNVNTGAFDPFVEIYKIAQKHNAWVHVDGAFGLWARVSSRHKDLVYGIEKMDSWTIDAHKWLNIPYDSGMVIIKNREAHSHLKTARCTYAGQAEISKRDGFQWVPENSRRARGFVLYAAMRNFGRRGISRIIENGVEMARIFAVKLSQIPEVKILNEVILNQILCRLEPHSVINTDQFNEAVSMRIQKEGICWIGTTHWNGDIALRISISNCDTTEDDINQSLESIKKSIAEELIYQNYESL